MFILEHKPSRYSFCPNYIKQSGAENIFYNLARQLTDGVEVVSVLAVVSLPQQVELDRLHLHTVHLVLRI